MKAQFWSFDVIFAMVIFAVAILILTYVWYNINNQFSLAYGNGVGNMEEQLNELSVRLLSAGSPPNWNSVVNVTNTSTWSNVSIGLGSGQSKVLSMQKIMTFSSMANYNYQATKQPLGIGFDYYILITGKNFVIPIGLNPNTNGAVTVQVQTEPVIIDGNSATIKIMVWTNSSFGIG